MSWHLNVNFRQSRSGYRQRVRGLCTCRLTGVILAFIFVFIRRREFSRRSLGPRSSALLCRRLRFRLGRHGAEQGDQVGQLLRLERLFESFGHER